MIPYSRPKLSDLYTLTQSKLLKNHTLQSDKYLYSPYTVVPPPPPPPRYPGPKGSSVSPEPSKCAAGSRERKAYYYLQCQSFEAYQLKSKKLKQIY